MTHMNTFEVEDLKINGNLILQVKVTFMNYLNVFIDFFLFIKDNFL